MSSAPAAKAGQRPWWRRVLRLLQPVAVCYLGVVILLLALENALLYHPVRADEEWLAPPGPGVQDVEFATADGTRIHGWWWPRPDADGALLYCHGNAGNLSHRGPGLPALRQTLKLSILIFDYPGYGRSDGSPSEAGCYAAADAAYEWLARVQNVPPERIVLYGKSLGGGVAVDLATRRPHRALVLVKTFTSIPDMAQRQFPFLPARWLVRNRFDSLAKIRQCPRPVFVSHGDCDTLIPFAHGQRLFAAANEPKRFFAMHGCDHNDPLNPDFLAALADFLSEAAPVPARESFSRVPRD
jgi:fermentation-respiration switch protein FrsA (DUF1100 family)